MPGVQSEDGSGLAALITMGAPQHANEPAPGFVHSTSPLQVAHS